MKKIIIMMTLVALMTSVNVEAKEIYHNIAGDDGIFHEEETITIYDEEDVQDNFLEEDELSWWQRLIQDIFPKEESVVIM